MFVLKIYENLLYPKEAATETSKGTRRQQKHCSREESGKSEWEKRNGNPEEQSSGQFAFSICSNKQEKEISAEPQNAALKAT